MRILLTGASGQVGGALRPLLEAGHEVIAPARPAFDLSEPAGLAARLDQIAPGLIVNPAAYTAVDRAEDEPELARRVNAEAPAAIAQWAARRGVPLLHVSTDYVFDGAGTRPWREDDPTAPLGVYGRTKLAGEQAVRAAGGAHLVVRTSWVYAAGGANFLRTMARLAAEREELRVVADQVGAPTSAPVIAAALAAILEQGLAAGDLAAVFARAQGLVHLACRGETSWHGFASAIVAGLRARGVPLKAERVTAITTADFPTKAKRPANSRLDLSRLSAAYGIQTPSWSEALPPELNRLPR